ncbi:glutamine--fructose-6-phosphate transaminase (isomerizing) [Cardiobacteriaceae bacterium TAE3-ERU3]|nr:glutamine--fructose-6-phosphate transaminase (isomerizing) [Cardiobacteriaceae bacterium TAE3-ERU3]
MCGIIGAVAERNVVPILIEGLKRLEYRGYDSAGLVVCGDQGFERCRALGKVAELAEKAKAETLTGFTGMAHTRWATHGVPSEANAHPHVSCNKIAVVHNGIIENHQYFRSLLQEKGYTFTSQTDSEVIAHLIHQHYQDNGGDLLQAVQVVSRDLDGAYALVVSAADRPDELVITRSGCPMVIGVGLGEHFIASDTYALLPVTRRFVYLGEDDVAVIRREGYTIYNAHREQVTRPEEESDQSAAISGKNGYKHFMQKEMFEQPSVIAETLEGRLLNGQLNTASFDPALLDMLAKVKQIHIIACGTSYHAGLVIKYHLERSGIATQVEVASEYLYRDVAVQDGTLFVAISQSGETADTLAALRKAKQQGYCGYIAVCNVPGSALVRASEHVLLTRAGREIGVASTKAFVTQLVALHLLNILLRQANNKPVAADVIEALSHLPTHAEALLQLDEEIGRAAKLLEGKHGCLFLGRGECYPIAMEGALKLKELSYIHAEAYPSGELKHGPLALVDEHMPVIAVVKADAVAEKVLSNLQEVQARGGRLLIFADKRIDTSALPDALVISLGELDDVTASVAAVIPLQLLAYHVALQRGTDVDQPRNLAKSVTVE